MDDPGEPIPVFVENGDRTLVLVIRIWRQTTAQGRTQIRGHLSVLGGARIGTFHSLPRLLALVEQALATPPDPEGLKGSADDDE